MIDLGYKHKGLIEPLKEIEGMTQLLEHLEYGENVKVVNMIDACKGHFSYGLSCFTKKPVVIVTYDEPSVKQIAEDMMSLKGKDKVYVYPSRDILFYNADVHSMDITSSRIKVIEALQRGEDAVFIIPVEALLNPLSPKETWESYTKFIKTGECININRLERELVQMGYERVGRVEAMGQFAIRGGIIDIYTPIDEEPYRIELWDDEVDSIRNFNVQTQRSIEKVEFIHIVPNQEIIFHLDLLKQAIPSIKEDLKRTAGELRKDGKRESALKIEEQVGEAIEQIQNDISPRGLELYIPYTSVKLVTVLDYLPKDILLIIDEPVKTRARCERVLDEYGMSMKDRLEYGHILPKQIELIYDYEHLMQSMEIFTKMFLMNFDAEIERFDTAYTLPLKVHENNTLYKNLDLLENDLRQWKTHNKRVIILSGVKAKSLRLMSELEERGIITSYSESNEEEVNKGQILIYKGVLEKGFYYEDLDFYIVADKELFGKDKKAKKSKKKYSGAKIQSFLELTPGDYVVHEQHGIGVFKGVEQIVIEGISRDNLKIEYADNNILYVNINQMDMVQKYIGSEGKAPKLSKLGGSEWKKSKAKVKGAIQSIAKDLVKLYSQRQYSRGFPTNLIPYGKKSLKLCFLMKKQVIS